MPNLAGETDDGALGSAGPRCSCRNHRRATAFRDACHTLLIRIRIFTSLPLHKLDHLSLGKAPRHRQRELGSAVRVWLAEGVGTALLLTAVVGSGIMGETLANGNAAIALLANSIATGCALYVLIVMFADVSGAHFNPLVTLVMVSTAWCRRLMPGHYACSLRTCGVAESAGRETKTERRRRVRLSKTRLGTQSSGRI